ncbi:MAG: hydrogenase nickel incorporation protein HypB [Betaproteobacteria bacterium SG8_39]|nr:MAG: hydrogenase nickel incorporation protein HypB [Betaproteobacteria bacterium SG8_39]
MCTTCGCGDGDTRIEGQGAEGWHRHADGTLHHHAQPGAHAHGATDPRRLRIEQDLLAANDAHAARNRARFAHDGIFALNLVSSPGSGKTTLLCRTIQALRGLLPVSVIEGDQQTRRDAERIRAAGAGALQVNTGKGCHLDAHMVSHAIAQLDPAPGSLLLIENVGNLVCPAAFDLGEAHKVVVLSITEGEDKPLKYPDMFAAADVMVLNKIDLAPHLSFDEAACIGYARRVNPQIRVLRTSATTGAGIDAWVDWLAAGARAAARSATQRAGPRGVVA